MREDGGEGETERENEREKTHESNVDENYVRKESGRRLRDLKLRC